VPITSATRAGRSARAGVLAGLAVGVAVGWNTANVGAVAAVSAEAYGVALAVVGLFTTALFVTHLATQVPGGRLVDRFGAHRVCILGATLIACGAAASMIAPAPALAIGARALTGVGTGLGFIAGTAYVRRSGGSAFSQGLYGGVGIGAAGAAIAIVPQLVAPLSWRAPYATALALAVVALVVLVAAPPDRSEAPVAVATPTTVVLDTGLYRLALLYSTTFGLALVLGNWIVELLETHLDGGEAGLIGGLILALGVLARPFGGWVVRSHGDHVRLAVGLSLVAGACGAALLAVAGSVPVAVLGCLLLGVGGGVSFSPAFTGAALLRPDAPAAAVGFVNATAAATVLVCTPLVGLTFSLPGEGRLGFAVAALVWLAALALLPDRRALGSPR